MKHEIIKDIEIPSDIDSSLNGNELTLKKGSSSITKKFIIPNVSMTQKDGKIIFTSKKGSKRELKVIMASLAHIKNMFSGLNKKYVYTLQACNVHFPMTLKVDGQRLVINNFLGEKKPRYANILSDVKVDVKGQILTVSSHNKDLAGQTAANIEKSTKVRNRDRRIFQDGIYITTKADQEKD